MHLKDNIIEHFDFEAVSPEVWRHIYSWYSADWCILRHIKKDNVNKFCVILDLYPEKKCIDLNAEADDHDDEGDLESSMRFVDVPDILSS